MPNPNELHLISFHGDRMNLTSENLRCLYTFLHGVEPFNKWSSMPKVADCVFAISFPDKLDTGLGCYVYCNDKHHLYVNANRHTHLETVVRTLSHLIVHSLRGDTKKSQLHDKFFVTRCAAVGASLGYDPHQLASDLLLEL